MKKPLTTSQIASAIFFNDMFLFLAVCFIVFSVMKLTGHTDTSWVVISALIWSPTLLFCLSVVTVKTQSHFKREVAMFKFQLREKVLVLPEDKEKGVSKIGRVMGRAEYASHQNQDEAPNQYFIEHEGEELGHWVPEYLLRCHKEAKAPAPYHA